MQLRNIMLNIVIDLLDQTLLERYDICKCEKCRADIIAYVLSRIPAKYVTTDVGAISTLVEQEKVENEAEIIRKIIDAIKTIGKHPHHKLKKGSKEDKDKAFELLLENIYTTRGIDFRRYLAKVLKRRISRRMGANKVKTYSDYLRILKSNPKEYDELFNVLTINISEFFRDFHIFNIITKTLSEVIENKILKGKYTIKIWSAGCASGEEPYSIAIALREIIEREGVPFNISIIATDIDNQCLEVAKTAEYRQKSLKNVNKYLLKKYFVPTNGKYRVKDEIRRLVTFYHHNLIADVHFENIDIVFCRNVFIFFNRSLQEHLIMAFYKALKKDGYLIMGAVETFLGEAKMVFREVDLKARIYQKI